LALTEASIGMKNQVAHSEQRAQSPLSRNVLYDVFYFKINS